MKDFHKKAIKEIKIWAWAATVLPMIAMAGIILTYLIGFSTWLQILIVTVSSVLFGIAVIWWWWALHTIAGITGILSNALGRFEKVEQEVVNLRTEIDTQIKKNADTRKRRK